MWMYFPDTNGMPLEEVAKLFGDEDEVAVYQAEINIQNGVIVDLHADAKAAQLEHVEDLGRNDSTKQA